MSKRPSLLPDLAASLVKGEPTDQVKPAKASKAPPVDDGMMRTSLYIPRPVHDVLREIAFHERLKIHDLIREGLDHVLTKRSYPSVSELSRDRKA